MSVARYRQALALNGAWRFVRDPLRRVSASDLPEGEAISVPGCWEAQVDEPFGIVHAWYWRDLGIPESWPRGGEAVLRLEAVMYRCEVWLNGKRIADHEGGYTPFEIHLSDLWRGWENRLALLVTNPMNAIEHYPALSSERLDRAESRFPELPIREIPHGKQTWYASQSGPWRGVELEWRMPCRIDRLRAAADWSTGAVTARAATRGTAGAEMELTVLDPSGSEVARTTLAAGAAVTAAMAVRDPQAWDVGVPNLYRLVARLRRDGEVVDEAETRFGFREIRTEGGRILLNGRPIMLRGALDQDLYADTISTPPGRELLDRQLALAREMGLNLLRCHIKTPDPAYLEAADEAGILLWCELPNSLVLTPASAARAETLLDDLVESVGDHPSVVIWTIINEDWGTDLRHSAADRRWLLRMVERLRSVDPGRLVVDNSPCPAAGGPNFHLDTDLADFHRYAAMPDAAPRWRQQMAELADRPAWLWSPHGDAVRRGDEPVVVSEFGTWGLPDPGSLDGPWWFESGDGAARPGGIGDRFSEQRLGRIWPDVAALSVGTRRLQVEALRYQVGEMRRHPSMAGLVVTELTDAYWEANGLLDVHRRPKPYHDRLAQIFGAATLIVDLERQDLWSGEQVRAGVILSADAAASGGQLSWRLGTAVGTMEVGPWNASTANPLGSMTIRVPSVNATTDLDLEVELSEASGAIVARSTVPVAILPDRARHPTVRSLGVHDPSGLWDLVGCLAADGHIVTDSADAELIVSSRLDGATLQQVNAGGHLLLLVRSADAMEPAMPLDRPAMVQARWPDHTRPGADLTWSGDWISSFSWIAPSVSEDLPRRAPLDFAYAQVMPDQVLRGYAPAEHADEVDAGMFVGWVHAPVALAWSFRQGAGRLTLTTFRVAPERGPVATALRNALIAVAARDPDGAPASSRAAG